MRNQGFKSSNSAAIPLTTNVFATLQPRALSALCTDTTHTISPDNSVRTQTGCCNKKDISNDVLLKFAIPSLPELAFRQCA